MELMFQGIDSSLISAQVFRNRHFVLRITQFLRRGSRAGPALALDGMSRVCIHFCEPRRVLLVAAAGRRTTRSVRP